MKNLRFKVGMSYGLLTSLIGLLVGLALYFTGLSDFQGGTSGIVSALIMGMGIYLGSEAFKKQNEGYLSTSDLVMTSLWLGLSYGLLNGAISAVYLHYIDPQALDKIKNIAEVQMEDQGTSEEQMQMALKMMDTFTSIPALMIIGLFSNTLFGVIIGSMLSIFLKKEKPTFD